MKKQITPCIWFNNQAKEAALLYCSVFEKSKITAESPYVTEIEASGQKFILLDGGPKYQPNASISFYYICENERELELIWKAFAKEGKVMMPLDKYPWSEQYGWVSDKFGVSWQLALGKKGAEGQKIIPSLLFTGEEYGRADEAIQLYSSIFENVEVDGILRFGANEAPDTEGKVKHAQIAIDGQVFMIAESAGQHDFTFSEGISFTVYCETQDEIDHYWNKLTESGEESMCGWLKDKFGVSWQIVPTMLGKIMSDPAKAGKAAQAFMSMRKLNIEQIVEASM
jgi:predicted 3-demethylubiquinone-9 3-methyltransferase (glyoxalase superfamily)